jgi:hypothetical protein
LPHKRAEYSRQALKQFAEAGAIRNEHYRFYVNYAECATQLYWLWYAHKQDAGKKFRTELLKALNDVLQMPQYELRSNPAGVTGEEVFGLLFKTIQGALERAGRYAGKLYNGACAPLVELNRFYFLLALRTAAGCGDVKADDFSFLHVVWGRGDESSGDFCALNKLTAEWILTPLEAALRGWLAPGENRLHPRRVRRLVEGLPGVNDWVKENFLDVEYKKVLALLDTPHMCEVCPSRSAPALVAVGAGHAS